jgi:hypothetical protein
VTDPKEVIQETKDAVGHIADPGAVKAPPVLIVWGPLKQSLEGISIAATVKEHRAVAARKGVGEALRSMASYFEDEIEAGAQLTVPKVVDTLRHIAEVLDPGQ